MNTSLKSALSRQRQKLGPRLKSNGTFAATFMFDLLQIQGVNMKNVSKETLSKFYIISRLIDNLLDDEKVDILKLTGAIKEQGLISEFDEFIDQLSEKQKNTFLKHARFGPRIMNKHNNNPNIKNRCFEAIFLTKLHVALIGEENISSSQREFLLQFHIAGYMFGDFKDFKEDNKAISDLVPIICGLVCSGTRSILNSERKVVSTIYLMRMIIASIKSKKT